MKFISQRDFLWSDRGGVEKKNYYGFEKTGNKQILEQNNYSSNTAWEDLLVKVEGQEDANMSNWGKINVKMLYTNLVFQTESQIFV